MTMETLDYTTLTPGIRAVVKLLRDNGFYTTDSGDGVTNVAAGMEGALPVPHVHCFVPRRRMFSETSRLVRLLRDAGLRIEMAMIQSVYDPADHKNASVSLYGVDDRVLSNVSNEQGRRVG
jgi:hypothetical protein